MKKHTNIQTPNSYNANGDDYMDYEKFNGSQSIFNIDDINIVIRRHLVTGKRDFVDELLDDIKERINKEDNVYAVYEEPVRI